MSITINGFEVPQHISYSAFSTYIDCGHKYYLTRMVKVSEPPAWYLIGGSALHSASEEVDAKLLAGEQIADTNLLWSAMFQTHWDTEMSRAVSEHPTVPESGYKAGGRASKAYPNKEDKSWWLENGPKMLKSWYDWRVSVKWSIWQPTPEKSGVELGIDLPLERYTLRMFIDRVMITPDGELVVLDLKTGSRTPSSDLQLAIYAAGIEKVFGIRPKWGTYWMARNGGCSEMVDLDYLPTDKVLNAVSLFDIARKDGIFLPNLSNCHYCSVAAQCEWSKK